MAGTGRCVYNEIVAEPLTKENCEYWFKCVRNYLIARDLWDVVDGTIATPPEDEDHKEDFVSWRKKNATALHVILISCGTHSFSQISHVCEAKLAWNILNDTYRHHPPEPESDQGPEPEPEPEPEPMPDLDPEQEPESEPALAPETVSKPSPLVLRRDEVDFDVAALYKAIYDNKWNTIKAIIDEHPSALTARLTYFDQTALHVAAEMGHVGIVEELVRLVPPEHLEILDNEGYTPLATAAYTGAVTPVVECMLNKNRNALGIPIPSMSLPVSLAFCNGHKNLGRYLYSLTPLEFLQPLKGTQGPKLLRYCFITGQLDIALDLLQRCKDLLFARDNRGQIPIMRIATMSFAFSRESQLVFWKRWIYNC